MVDPQAELHLSRIGSLRRRSEAGARRGATPVRSARQLEIGAVEDVEAFDDGVE
jgi:hypothetical protein